MATRTSTKRETGARQQWAVLYVELWSCGEERWKVRAASCELRTARSRDPLGGDLNLVWVECGGPYGRLSVGPGPSPLGDSVLETVESCLERDSSARCESASDGVKLTPPRPRS